MNKIMKKNYPLWVLFPGLFIFLLLFIYPTLKGIYYSFQYWDIFSTRFAGLDNYISVFSDPEMKVALPNTLIFTTFTVFFKVLFGMILAVILNQNLKTTNYLRTSFFLPAIISTIAVGLMFTAMLHPEHGIVNKTLHFIGLSKLAQSWLTNPNIAIYSVSAIEVWKWTGFTMVIFLSGLQAISKEYYEAADIDGATTLQKFRYITFPLLMPAFNNAVVISLIGGLKVFDIIQGTTQGGPGNATAVLNTVIFKNFGNGYYGEACAANVILSIIVSIFAFSTYSLIHKREVEE